MSWVTIVGFLLVFILLYVVFFTWVETLFGVAFLCAISFIVSLIVFNQGAVESFLIIKWWQRTSVLTPFKVDRNPLSGNIKSIQAAIQALKDRKTDNEE
jgi:hypothetical protein